MENTDKTPASFESVWATLQEVSAMQAENARRMFESDARFERERAESNAKFERELAESSAKFERELAESRAEYDKRSAELDRRIKEVNDSVNGISKSNGMFAEEFFFTTIEEGEKKIFGEQFDECFSLQKRKNKAHQLKGEQDIILSSNEAVAFVEVKYRARKEDAEKIIAKLPNLRILYPQHNLKRIYLGIAALSFDMDVETACNKNGIAIVKQVGDTVVVNDEYLKAH